MAPQFVTPYRMSGKRGKNDAADAAAICEAATVRLEAHKQLEDLPDWCNTVMGDALNELTNLDARIKLYDQYIEQSAKKDEQSRQLMQLSGIGSTTATAIVATVGKGHDFTCSRQFCAWLGLVPGQYSSGGKQCLGCITKASDPYLRTLLIMGGKAVLAAVKKNRPGEPLGN